MPAYGFPLVAQNTIKICTTLLCQKDVKLMFTAPSSMNYALSSCCFSILRALTSLETELRLETGKE
jgi:hypothetical protein